MKCFIRKTVIMLINVAILITMGMFAIQVERRHMDCVQAEMITENSKCVCLTDDERELLSKIISQEANTQTSVIDEVVEPEKQGVIANQSAAEDVEKDKTVEYNGGVATPLNAEKFLQLPYTEEELNILALIIYQEAGANIYSDETRMMVGNVFLNRVKSDEFPNTFYEVATAYKQYGSLYWTGIVWPERSTYETEKAAVERAFNCAKRLLDGERVFETDDVIWQAEFSQGTETVKIQDGIYFCK